MYRTVPITIGACSSCASVTLTAQAVGSVRLTFTEAGGLTRLIWVHVNTSNTLPHFGTDGSLLSLYNSAKSFFMTSVFSSDQAFTDFFYPSPFNYGQDSSTSGLNAAETGCQTGAFGNSTTQNQFQTAQTSFVSTFVAFLKPYGMYWNCTGDNMMRGNPNVYFTTQGPGASWTPSATQYTFNSLINQRLISVDMVDEVNAIWGDRPIQAFTWGSGLSGFTCVSGGNCTVTCSSSAQSGLPLSSGCQIQGGSSGFIVTGSGDSNLDYNTSGNAAPYVLNGHTIAGTNGGYSQFTFPTPAGVGNATYTSGSNPGLIVNWAVASTFDASGNQCPPLGVSAGPCAHWIANNAFTQFMSQANAATGRPPITWDVQGGYDYASVQNWMGDPLLADFAMQYFPNTITFDYAAGSLPVSDLEADPGFNYRNRYAALPPAARLKPILSLGQGSPVNYGLQGYPVTITSISGNLVTFAAPHGITTISTWDTRLWITGNSSGTYNANFYVTDCPDSTHCHIAFAAPTFSATATGSFTGTLDNATTFAVSSMTAVSGKHFREYSERAGESMRHPHLR